MRFTPLRNDWECRAVVSTARNRERVCNTSRAESRRGVFGGAERLVIVEVFSARNNWGQLFYPECRAVVSTARNRECIWRFGEAISAIIPIFLPFGLANLQTYARRPSPGRAPRPVVTYLTHRWICAHRGQFHGGSFVFLSLGRDCCSPLTRTCALRSWIACKACLRSICGLPLRQQDTLDIVQLEERLLFSAMPMAEALVIDFGDAGQSLDAVQQRFFGSFDAETSVASSANTSGAGASKQSAFSEHITQELVFVDRSAANYQQLIDDSGLQCRSPARAGNRPAGCGPRWYSADK